MTTTRLLLVALCMLGGPAVAHAADGVDVVTVAKQGDVRGRIVRREADGTLVMAVRREWLAGALSDLAADAARDDRLGALAARDELRRRIDAALRDLPAADRRRTFLESERARIERLLADPARDPAARAEFTWVRIPARNIRREQPADPAAAGVVQWAWSAGLDGPETRDQRRLARELSAQGIDPQAAPPTLADRLPPVPEDDRAWAARLALVADALDEPVAFQGMGDIQVPVAGLADAERVLPILEGTLGGKLDDLLAVFGGGKPARAAPDQWLASARTQAQAAGRCRATRLRLDAQAGRVEIESAFQVRFPDGTWETVWRDREVADGTAARPLADERLTADPRVKTVLDAVRAIGLVEEQRIDRALGMGAATLDALAAIDARFATFRSLHTRQLDGPPLWWAAW